MPNTFAPKALEIVMKDRVSALRMEYGGPAADVKEWHALVDMLAPEAREDFMEEYARNNTVPHVVSGFEDEGLRPEGDGE